MAHEPNSPADGHADTTPPPAEAAAPGPFDTIIEQAEQLGIRVVHRGKISPEVVAAYKAAQDGTPDT